MCSDDFLSWDWLNVCDENKFEWEYLMHQTDAFIHDEWYKYVSCWLVQDCSQVLTF